MTVHTLNKDDITIHIDNRNDKVNFQLRVYHHETKFEETLIINKDGFTLMDHHSTCLFPIEGKDVLLRLLDFLGGTEHYLSIACKDDETCRYCDTINFEFQDQGNQFHIAFTNYDPKTASGKMSVTNFDRNYANFIKDFLYNLVYNR